jgi:1,4-alpha-glucan branching enzyme
MSLKKQMLKSKPVCKVTFRVSKEMAAGADSVTVVGDFNNWDPIETPMKRLQHGEFSCSLELESGKSYEFRYLVGGQYWYNDPEADGYAANSFGSENSVVTV